MSWPRNDQGQRPSLHDDGLALALERLAWLMDRAFAIPGTRVRVGLDALLGLLPVGGDLATGAVQALLVLVALGHYKVPREVAAKMMLNVLLDVSVGAIPILGDVFDVAFKANTRNIRLLEAYRGQRPAAGPGATAVNPPMFSVPLALPPGIVGISWLGVAAIGVTLFGVLALIAIGFVAVLRWLFVS